MNVIILIIVLLVKSYTYYSALTQEIVKNHETPKFKVDDSVKITNYKNIFSKSYAKNWSREIFLIESVMKANPWAYRIKDSNGAKINRKFL